MIHRLRRLGWVPPLAVGLCAATAAEVAVALLLYEGPGFMRSLTAVLSVEATALGLGVWVAHSGSADPEEELRRRWLFCLVTFLLATLFAGSWSLVAGLGGTPLGQGLGLALMAALPLYGAGGVLGSLESAARAFAGAEGGSVGGPALVGAAVGFAGTGAALPKVVTPASLLLVCLVVLSGSALVYGLVREAQATHAPSEGGSAPEQAPGTQEEAVAGEGP